MNMAEYILSILKSQIFVLLSWGFHRPVRLENGLRFQVQGFIHKGTVEVVYVEGLDLFEVRTLNADGSIKQKEEDVYLDCLVFNCHFHVLPPIILYYFLLSGILAHIASR